MSAKLKASGSISGQAPIPPATIVIGGSVQVSPAGLNVRSTPAGTLVGTQAPGAIGVVLAGPQIANFNGVPVTWWQLNFPTGADGWAGDDNLIPVAAPPPAIKPTYTKWDTRMQAFILTGAAPAQSPAQVSAWLSANPPIPD